MTPISEYSEQLGVSRWTIQMAIKFLLENDCMVFEKHGTLGTYAVSYTHLVGMTATVNR